MSPKARRDPALRLERARLAARTLPAALGLYALMTVAILFPADLREPPEVLGYVAGAQLVGAVYLSFAFLLVLTRIQALEARLRALAPGQFQPGASLALPTGAMLASA